MSQEAFERRQRLVEDYQRLMLKLAGLGMDLRREGAHEIAGFVEAIALDMGARIEAAAAELMTSEGADE